MCYLNIKVENYPSVDNKTISVNILHVTPTYFPATRYGGPIYSVHGLAKGQVENGNKVDVFTTNVDGESNSDVPLRCRVDREGVGVFYFRCPFLRRLYYSPGLKKALCENIHRYDIVHLHSIFLWPTWIASKVAFKNRVTVVLSPRGMLVKDLIKRKNPIIKTLWIKLIEKSNLRRASLVHFTAEIEKKEAEKFDYTYNKTCVIPNGLEQQAFLKPSGERQFSSKAKIVFLGRINWKKGLDRLIRALPYIKNATLEIVGNDEENYREHLEGVIKKENVGRRILFKGPANGNAKMEVFKKANLFVLPSYSENFGNVALEAMAASCPTAVTRNVGVSEVIEKYNAGYILSDEPETMGKEINCLLKDQERLNGYAERGYRVAHERYTWSSVAEEMTKAYEELGVKRN